MKTFLLVFIFLISNLIAVGQVETENKDSLVVITMTNGEVRIGKILNDDGREILLESREVGKYISERKILKA